MQPQSSRIHNNVLQILLLIVGVWLILLCTFTVGSAFAALRSGGDITAQPDTCAPPTWCIVSALSPDPVRNELYGLTVLAYNDAWAVGGRGLDDRYHSRAVAQHWNGIGWNGVNPPQKGNGSNVLLAVSAVSTNSVWAVGSYYSDTGGYYQYPLMKRYNGSSWQDIPTVIGPNAQCGGTGLAAVSALTDNDVWAMGSYNNGDNGGCGMSAANPKDSQKVNQPYGQHCSLSPLSCTLILPPAAGVGYNNINGMAAITTGNVWAVGWYSSDGITRSVGSPRPLILHHTGNVITQGWTVMTLTVASDSWLNSVDYFGADDLWAVGVQQAGVYSHNLIAHYDGITWTVASNIPNPGSGDNTLQSVYVTGARDVWTVGKQTSSGGVSSGLVLHWNGSSLDDINGDKWDVVPVSNLDATSNRFYSVAAPPSTNTSRAITNVWAVGSAYNGQYSLVENIKAPDAPTSTTTTSFYESTISPTVAYTQGKEAALQHKTGIFVLDYGRPKNWSTTSNPITGTELIDAPAGLKQATIIEIQESAKGFLRGYDENASPRPPMNSVYVAVATNNYSKTTNLVYDPAELTIGHGREWGQMVNNVQSYANTQGFNEMKIVAAIDAEPNWSDYSKVYDWIKGYSSVTSAGYYNFGSLDGYPCVDGISFPLPASIKGDNDGCPRAGWRMQQFFELSWELRGAHPLPEIYDPLWAREWYLIKHWGIDNKPSFPAMRFDGMMTDCKPGDVCLVSEFNPKPAFTTNQGWQSIWLELNSEISTTQALPWSTTITHTNTLP